MTKEFIKESVKDLLLGFKYTLGLLAVFLLPCLLLIAAIKFGYAFPKVTIGVCTLFLLAAIKCFGSQLRKNEY